MSDSNDPSVPDKKALYGEWEKGERWRRRAAHKAIDMADDEMQVSVNKSTGISTTGLVGAALAAGIPSAIVALAMLFKGGGTPAPAVPQGPTPSGYEWKVDIFRDKDGKIGQRVTPVEPGK